MSRKRNALVLLAGGRGTRMGTGVHKQFLELGGKPLIWHSLNAVQKSDLIDDVILVSGEDDMAEIRELVSRYGFDKVSIIVKGGEERYLSVANGVKAIFDRAKECEAFSGIPGIILVHDGARPFIDDEIIGRCLDGVEETGGCVAAVPSKDTVKLADENAIVTSEPPRDMVWNMQTPQVFFSQILYDACVKASEADVNAGITDDARMVSMFTDTKIKLVMGSYENIKITTPVDVLIAGKILEDKIGHIS
jgi:2-C-methyl-D-erythritol 4-phosphate cytidylyltransferase